MGPAQHDAVRPYTHQIRCERTLKRSIWLCACETHTCIIGYLQLPWSHGSLWRYPGIYRALCHDTSCVPHSYTLPTVYTHNNNNSSSNNKCPIKILAIDRTVYCYSSRSECTRPRRAPGRWTMSSACSGQVQAISHRYITAGRHVLLEVALSVRYCNLEPFYASWAHVHESTPQTGSRSVQPFLPSSPVCPTHKHTFDTVAAGRIYTRRAGDAVQ